MPRTVGAVSPGPRLSAEPRSPHEQPSHPFAPHQGAASPSSRTSAGTWQVHLHSAPSTATSLPGPCQHLWTPSPRATTAWGTLGHSAQLPRMRDSPSPASGGQSRKGGGRPCSPPLALGVGPGACSLGLPGEGGTGREVAPPQGRPLSSHPHRPPPPCRRAAPAPLCPPDLQESAQGPGGLGHMALGSKVAVARAHSLP